MNIWHIFFIVMLSNYDSEPKMNKKITLSRRIFVVVTFLVDSRLVNST
jgi:hypothetical protein